MPSRRWSSVAALLLIVSCVTAGSAATQQQEEPSPINIRIIPLRDIAEKAVRAELSRKCESNKDTDGEKSQLEELTARLGKQESQLEELGATLNSIKYQLAEKSSSEKSRLDVVFNMTASQHTQINQLAVRLNQVEGKTPIGDCSELSAGAQSGIYLLRLGLDNSLPPVEAYCDLVTDGGNWTVFQRRANIEPHQDFYLGWAAYKEGFGELSGEFWWGLDKLWRTTAAPNRRYELRVDLESFAGEKAHAIYQNFRISSEDDGFRLSADNYRGDAGDDLSGSVNHQFSTRDRDQDGNSRYHCAQEFTGAWWYDSCYVSSLNNPYRDGPDHDDRGILWFIWKGTQSLKKTTMKIRRVVYEDQAHHLQSAGH